MEAVVSDFGAVLVSLYVPDKDGKKRDVVLGFDEVQQYETNNSQGLGATVGRNGNRIGQGRFELNGKTYQLKLNDNERNNLHSGGESYHFRMWDTATVAEGDGEDSVTFLLLSPDGDQGFPGNFDVKVTYTLTDDNELKITYDGTPDQDTIVNMTNHSYFNLNGHQTNEVESQYVWLDADAFTATDEFLIPTGELVDVTGTAMDFREEKTIGRDIEAKEEALLLGNGYDHNWALNHQGSYRKVASMRSEESGIKMEVYTDLPGIQFYTGNFLEGAFAGKDGVVYQKRAGACFETQCYPDAPNHEHFPTTFVKAGERYYTVTAYKFV